MNFFSFVKRAVKTVSKVSSTASAVCKKIEPLLETEAGAGKAGDTETPINVGWVQFTNSTEMLTLSLDLKRLETFANAVSESASILEEVKNTTKTCNQIVWLDLLSTMLAEALFLQQTLLSGTPGTGFDYKDTTKQYKQLVTVADSFATDLAATAIALGAVATYVSPSSGQVYSAQTLGRSDTTWEYAGMNVNAFDSSVQSLASLWAEFLQVSTKSGLGPYVKGLQDATKPTA